MKKSLISLAVSICLVLSLSSVVFAATIGMSAHVVQPGSRVEYYDANGFSVAKGNSISMTAYLDNQYSWSAGIREVSSNPISYTVSNGNASAVNMSKSVSATALYTTWIQNNTSVPMNVTSGSIAW